MKLLYVHGGADLYGASRSLIRLTDAAVRDGHRVWVVIPENGQLRAALERVGVEVIVQPDLAVVSRVGGGAITSALLLGLRLVSSSWRLTRTLRRLRPDVAHSNSATVLSGAFASRIARVPHVWHIREMFGEFPLAWRCHRWFIGLCSEKIICISGAVAAQFHKTSAERKVDLVYDGLPPQDCAPPSPERVREFRSRLNIPNEAPLAAVVGRIKFGRKGQETFVRAAARVVALVPSATFLIIGKAFPGNELHFRRLKSLVDELNIADKVLFTGELEDMSIAYSAIDLLVLSSGLPEPFGLVLIEAMSFGKPVVATAHGGALEIVEDGECGYLVPPNCPEQMAVAMGRVLGDRQLAASLGRKGRLRVDRLFRFEVFYESIRAMYCTLVSESVLTARTFAPGGTSTRDHMPAAESMRHD